MTHSILSGHGILTIRPSIGSLQAVARDCFSPLFTFGFAFRVRLVGFDCGSSHSIFCIIYVVYYSPSIRFDSTRYRLEVGCVLPSRGDNISDVVCWSPYGAATSGGCANKYAEPARNSMYRQSETPSESVRTPKWMQNKGAQPNTNKWQHWKHESSPFAHTNPCSFREFVCVFFFVEFLILLHPNKIKRKMHRVAEKARYMWRNNNKKRKTNTIETLNYIAHAVRPRSGDTIGRLVGWLVGWLQLLLLHVRSKRNPLQLYKIYLPVVECWCLFARTNGRMNEWTESHKNSAHCVCVCEARAAGCGQTSMWLNDRNGTMQHKYGGARTLATERTMIKLLQQLKANTNWLFYIINNGQ